MFSPCSPFCLLCSASSLPGLLRELALAWGCASGWGGAVGQHVSLQLVGQELTARNLAQDPCPIKN